MNMTATASYRAAPSRFIFVPRGIRNCTMLLSHPYSSPHSIVTGMVAALEEVLKPIIRAGRNDLQQTRILQSDLHKTHSIIGQATACIFNRNNSLNYEG